MHLPEAFLTSLRPVPGFDEPAFLHAHHSGEPVTSIRLHPEKMHAGNRLPAELFAHAERRVAGHPVPWTRMGWYLDYRPSFTFDPLFHAGTYYVQEASSMFLEQALIQTAGLQQPLRILDLCAAPGGKSTHLQSLIGVGSLLVSNEVIRARTGILRQNMIKWGGANVVVTQNDPQHFSRLPQFFDVVVADAPCSGSGLFRKEPEAVQEWSPAAVQLCCGRQRRILSDVLPALRPGGVLIYSTCSYSREENEDVADWLVEQGLESIALTLDPAWGIVEARGRSAAGYRFFPDKLAGEGFYLAVLRKAEDGAEPKWKTARPVRADKKEVAAAQAWLRPGDWAIYKEPHLYALPALLSDWYGAVKNALYVQYAGVQLGTVMKDRLVPEHALALSPALSPDIPATEAEYEDAIRYLQRADLKLAPTHKGWQLIRYRGHNLGWMNALQNRINNYYPKEFRILKQEDAGPFEK